MSDYKYLVNDFIIGNGSRIIIGSDENLEKVLRRQLGKREAVYTTLLQDYSNTTKKRNGLKEFHKWIFFWAVMITGFFVILLVSAIVYKVLNMDNDDFIRSVPIIITAFVSLISTVIGIPMTITRFLFNTEEDDNITQTIHHTQEHDSDEVILLLKDQDNDNSTEPESESEVESDLGSKPEENEHNDTTIPNSAEKNDAPDLIIVSGEMTTLDEKDKPYTTDVPEDEDDLDTADDPNEEFSPMI